MKKVLIIIVIIVAIVLLYTMRDNSPIDNTAKTEVNNSSGNIHPDPSGGTFIIDEEPITLSSGRNEREVVPGSALTEETNILDKLAYGDINSDGKQDTALLLARYGGGSGTFIYIAAFVSGPVNYKGSDAVFIGDRIVPQSISINGGVVTLKYLDRGPDDAFSTEPTISMSKQFVYKNGGLQEK